MGSFGADKRYILALLGESLAPVAVISPLVSQRANASALSSPSELRTRLASIVLGFSFTPACFSHFEVNADCS